MPDMCPHRLWNDPDGLTCDRETAHDAEAAGGHTYRSGAGCDLDQAGRHADGGEQ